MFFSFCCAAAESAEVPSPVTPRPNKIWAAPITPALLHEPKKNWPTLVNMMYLKSTDLLHTWRAERRQVEIQNTEPSFELLAVALYINDIAFLNELATQTNGDLALYIASRNSERDCFGHLLWHFTHNGIASELVAQAQSRNLISDHQLLAKTRYYDATLIPDIVQMHQTLYSGDLLQIKRTLKAATSIHSDLLFATLAFTGCWQGLLICIVNGYCHPIATDVFQHFAKCCDSEFNRNAIASWEELVNASRSPNSYDDATVARILNTNKVGTLNNEEQLLNAERTYKKTLGELIADPLYPELCLTYLVFRFKQPEIMFIFDGKPQATANKKFYADLINQFLLKNCIKPAVLELLCYCPREVAHILSSDTKIELRKHLQGYSVGWVEFLCPQDEPDRRAETRMVVAPKINVSDSQHTLN